MSRVEYRERQVLRAEDLRAEQDYLLALAGRHYLGSHTWGIVRGLELVTNGKAILTPGLAIDGYGRELLLSHEVELPDINIQIERYVYLFYCERSKGGCGGTRHARWRDTPEVIVTTERLAIPEEVELSVARAAGASSDLPPWPVLLAVMNANNRAETDDDYRLTTLRAARVTSPSGRAIMRIGQENLADPYHFRITAQDEKGVLQNRFAIDREGTLHLWGNLVLQGSGFAGVVVSEGQALEFASPKKVLWRVLPQFDEAGKKSLELRFRDYKNPGIEQSVVLKPYNARSLTSSLRYFNNNPAPLRLRLAIARPSPDESAETTEALESTVASEPVEAVEATKAAPSDSGVLDDREQPLPRAGALIKFWDEQDNKTPGKEVFCGCRESGEMRQELPRGFRFEATSEAPTIPDSRDIYSFKAGTVERPIEDFRISGGLFAKGDFSSRFSVGGSKSKPTGGATPPSLFTPWLYVRGDGHVVLQGGKTSKEGKYFNMIDVVGTTEYPPVRPDPRDPLFTFLTTFAFLNGILALSSSLVKVGVIPPKFIETGNPKWAYTLSVQNLSLTEPLTPFLGQEVIRSIKGMTNDNQLKLPAKVEMQSTERVTIEKKTVELPPGPEIEIEVTVTMSAGGAKVGGKARSPKIPVYESPDIEANIPKSVTAGTSVDFMVGIENGPSRKITLSPIQVDGLGNTQYVPTDQTELEPNKKTKSKKITIPAQADGAADLTITIKVTYLWEGQQDPTVVTDTKTVIVKSEVVP